jgi:HSP20 family protein
MTNLSRSPFRLEPVDLGWGGVTLLPHIDVRETDDSVLIQADLAGVRARGVELEAVGGVLTLRADRRDDGAGRDGQSWEMFERSIPLPSDADPRQATARFDNGELLVTVPKSAGNHMGRTKIAIAA